jgi:signal transduction histidine kinase/CheY-like chemotaxis protein
MSTASLRPSHSLRGRLVLFFGGLLLVTAGALGYAFYRQARALLQNELASRGESLARSLAFHSKYGVITRDDVQLLEVSDWAFAQAGVAYVEIRAADGEILLRRGAPRALALRSNARAAQRAFVAPVVTVVEPAVEGGDELLGIPFDERRDGVGRNAAGTLRGQAEIGLSTAGLDTELHRLAVRSALLVVALLIVGGAGLFLFLRVVVTPIRLLAEATDRVAQGDLGRRVPVRGHDEIARLAMSFNAMGESLVRTRERLERNEAELEDRVRQRTAELERANRSLRDAQQQLVQAEKLSAIGRLVSGVAHELNNPLAAVLGNAEMIELSEERAQERATVIRREAERCRRIVRDLLTFSRSTSVSQGEVDLNRLVSDVLATQAERLREAGVEVDTRLSAAGPVALGDAHRLEQLLVNLLTNAVDALHARPVPRRVVVGTHVDAEGLRLFVSDNGAGIAPEHLGRIFEPFFTTKPVGQGTGLGLALCYGIVREHNGRIEALNNRDSGACFRVTLVPRGSPCVAPMPAQGPDRPAAADVGRKTAALSILVVDDDVAVAELIEDALVLAGHRVTRAANGRHAVDRLTSGRFDLVLSDLRMPELDGVGLHAEIARRWPDMLERIVFITGDQAGDETRAFLARTGVPCLGKPFSLTELDGVLVRARDRLECSP